jgi:TDG/mug DNA glycosylase family protein
VAFAGSRQFKGLLNVGRRGKGRVAKVELGRQQLLPAGWPLPASSQVWVLPSTSGACPLSNEAREAPWAELAGELARHGWPRVAGAAACPAGELLEAA